MSNTSEVKLIEILHKSVQQIIKIFSLIKAEAPQMAGAKSINTYASCIENMLKELNSAIPKLCVPMALFKQYEKENKELNAEIEEMRVEERTSRIEIKVLEEKWEESESKIKKLEEEIKSASKTTRKYEEKINYLKKSGEEGVKTVIEAIADKSNRHGRRQSLPSLNKKEKVSLLWLMGSDADHTEKLARHLLSKR